MEMRRSALSALAVFRDRGGTLRTSEALARGIHPGTLYSLSEAGHVQRVSRGVYRLAELPELGEPDLVEVAARVPKAVLCLISALDFHGMTREIPHQIHIALPRGAKPPRLAHLPLRIFHFSGAAWAEGIEAHDLDGVKLRVYDRAKTVADCFKFRNRVGIDVAVDALKNALERSDVQIKDVLRYARIDRVEKVMRPYLEALQ